MALPRNPKEALQRPRKPQAQHLTDYDIRKIDDEKTLDSLLGLDDASLDRPTNLPSADEAIEKALAAEAEEEGILPEVLPDLDAPELPDLDEYDDGDSGALPDLDTPAVAPVASDDAPAPQAVDDPFADFDLDDGGDSFDLGGLPDFDEDNDVVDSVLSNDVPPADFWATPAPDEPKASDVLDDAHDALDSLWGEPSDTSSAADSWTDTSDDDTLTDLDDVVDSVDTPVTTEGNSQGSIPEDIMAMLEGEDLDFSDFLGDIPEDTDESESPFRGLDMTAANSDLDDDPAPEAVSPSIDISATEGTSDGEGGYSSGWGEVSAMFDDDTPESADDDALAELFAEYADEDDYTNEDFDLGDLPDVEEDTTTDDTDTEYELPSFGDDEEDEPEDDDYEVMPSLTKEEQDDGETPDHESDDDEHEPLRFVMPPILAPLKAVWGAIRGGYMFVVKWFFKALLFILGILSNIPVIGKVFSVLASMTQLLQRIAMALPLVFVIAVFAVIWWFSLPGSDDVELPDMGSATVSSFSYDKSTGETIAEIENTGEVIAEVQVDFSIRSLQPTWNPKTWMIPEEVDTCGAQAAVEIDDTATVSATCAANVDGWFPRATGEISPGDTR